VEYTYFIIRRFLWSLLVLLGLSVVIFTVARVVPGDPARIALGPLATAEQVENLREKMGLNRPIYVQYWRYVQGLVQGDMGQSLLTQRSVTRDLRTAFPATLELVLTTMIIAVSVGLPTGVFAARYKDTAWDNIGRIVSLFGVVTPAFFIALLLQLLVGYYLSFLPVSGRLDPSIRFIPQLTGMVSIDALLRGEWRVLGDAMRHLLLPSLALAAATIGQIARLTRSSMIDVSRKDFIEATRAFGIPERVTTFKYMLKPSFIPTLTILGLEFASLLGNAFLVEMVFGWPGMASYGVRAILQKDFNAIMGVVMVTGAFFVFVNLLIDVLLGYFDPRIRLRGSQA
jgi:peptide/nickel transport system permease protein